MQNWKRSHKYQNKYDASKSLIMLSLNEKAICFLEMRALPTAVSSPTNLSSYKADSNKFSLNLIFDHVTRKSIKGYLLSSVNHYTGLVTIKQASFTCMIFRFDHDLWPCVITLSRDNHWSSSKLVMKYLVENTLDEEYEVDFDLKIIMGHLLSRSNQCTKFGYYQKGT